NGEAKDWLDKEPPRSILTWDDLVSKFINQFFPPSKTTYLRNKITNFFQEPNETFNEAWERFKGLLRQCPHHGFSELHQLDTFYNSLNSNDQDALDSAAGGNFLDKMPQEGLAIIESKSKVRYSRSRANDSRVSTDAPLSTSSPSNNSFDMQQIAASLEDKMTIKMKQMMNEMKALVVTNKMDIRMSRLEKMISEKNVTTPATVKAVEEVCVTCGSNHNFNNCPLTRNEFPVFHDNIHQFQQTAAVGNFVQRNPPNLANQMRPPGFNQPNVQNNQGNQSRYQGNNFNSNQNRGSNFNQGQVYQPPTIQPPVYQAPPQQMQGVSKTDFENYVKANDAVLRNMQNQGQGLQNQMTNLTEMLSKFITSNTASSSNSGTLPSQTVTNPREHVNAITTRSGKTYEGPSTPLVPTLVVSTPSKEPEQNLETSMDKVQKPSLESTAQVPPPEEEDSIFIEIPKPKAKKTVNVEIQEPNSPKPTSYQPKLPYPKRMKVRENDKPSAQHSRFLKMFKQLRLEIGLKDALVEMPKFNKWLSGLLRNKEKLEEIAITTVNAKCSAIIMNKVPEKLEDPGKFLILCALQELDRTSALAYSGASINLLPHSIYKQLGLGALTPTRMTIELANHSITHPMGIAEDVVVRVDGFTFLVDFVVVNFEPDPRVPIILGRPFLRTARLYYLYEETSWTLRVDDPFSGSTTTHNDPSPSSSPVKTMIISKVSADELAPLDSLPPEDNNDEIDDFLAMEVSSNLEEGYFDSEGDVIFLDNLLSDDASHNLAPKFAGELLTLPSRNDREFEEYLSLMTVLCEISTSQSQEIVHTNQSSVIESLPVSPIPVEDSEPAQEEFDIFFVPDDLIPPGVENDDSEDEVNESPNLDHQDDPLIPRPPPEPPIMRMCFNPSGSESSLRLGKPKTKPPSGELTPCDRTNEIPLKPLGSVDFSRSTRSFSSLCEIRYIKLLSAYMQDLYDRMGRMEIRQEAIERMEYRQLYHWDRYQGVFEHMAGVYSIPLQGAYKPDGYAQPQYDQYYQQYPPPPSQYQQQQQDDDE
ncbi:reverse transcriptase domain-containing protein, partial [Tanacetum coccineum]